MSASGEPEQKRPKCTDELDEYYMAHAYVASLQSKDPETKVGACIVSKDNKIVGIGYNGMPTGCESISWSDKRLYVCHAEMNAICAKSSADLTDSTIYATLIPCNECTKLIVQLGIKKVVYLEDRNKNKYHAARQMMRMAGIKLSKLDSNKSFTIDFKKFSGTS